MFWGNDTNMSTEPKSHSASAGRRPWLLFPVPTSPRAEGPSWDQISTSGGCRSQKAQMPKHTLRPTAFDLFKEIGKSEEFHSSKAQSGHAGSWALAVCSMFILPLHINAVHTTRREEPDGWMLSGLLQRLYSSLECEHHTLVVCYSPVAEEEWTRASLTPALCYRKRMPSYRVFSHAHHDNHDASPKRKYHRRTLCNPLQPEINSVSAEMSRKHWL